MGGGVGKQVGEWVDGGYHVPSPQSARLGIGTFPLNTWPSCWKQWHYLALRVLGKGSEAGGEFDENYGTAAPNLLCVKIPRNLSVSSCSSWGTMRTGWLGAGLWLVSMVSARPDSLACLPSLLGGVLGPGEPWAGVFIAPERLRLGNHVVSYVVEN